MIDYSQHREQEFILKYFEDQPEGHFLDIGAYDGITFSNTRALLDKPGWKGTAVEASPLCFTHLCTNLAGFNVRKICTLLLPQDAIVDHQRLHKFYDANGDAVGTSNEANKAIWDKAIAFKEIWLAAIKVRDLVHTCGNAFDFINIDIEGGSPKLFEEIVAGFFFKLICVEHDGLVEFCNAIAEKEGLTLIHMNGVNAIYGR